MGRVVARATLSDRGACAKSFAWGVGANQSGENQPDGTARNLNHRDTEDTEENENSFIKVIS